MTPLRQVFTIKAPWAQTTTPAERRKTYVVAAVGIAVLVAGAFGGYEAGHPAYLRWKSDRAVKQARVALGNHDDGQARMALRVAMAAGLSQDGYAALAEYYESVGSPAAVGARQSVFKNSPHDLNARLALIAAALRFHDIHTADDAIATATPAEKKDLRMQSAAAILALQTNQLGIANFILDQMQAAAPHDESIRFARADVMIHHPKAATADAARQELAGIAGATGPEQLPALRTLLRDALARKDKAASARWGRALIARSDATLGDLLNAADGIHPPVPQETQEMDPELRKRVEMLARAGEPSAENYTRWLLARGRGVAAEEWLDSLDPTLARLPRLSALRADAAEASAEWGDLEARLQAGAWGPIPSASIELGFAARGLEAQGDHALAIRTFQASLDQSKSSDSALHALEFLADRAWHWPAAAVMASGAQVMAFPKDARGYPLWVQHLRGEANTAALRDALDGWRMADPANLEARYNWAVTALLVESPKPSAAAADVLEKFYQSDVNNPLYITGAAFARFRLGQAKSAAELMAKLKPTALARPQRAPYEAAIFAGAGLYEAARTAIKLAPAPDTLLPEERELLRQAAAQCGG